MTKRSGTLTAVEDRTPAGHGFENWIWVTALITLALVARILFLGLFPSIFDDAYITFRYARNIVSGLGFVYNTGQPVYGASSPLYTFVSAGIAAVVGENLLPSVARWIGCLALFGFVVVVWKVLPVDAIFRTFTVMALLSYPRVFYSSLGGMEECAILLLMGLSFLATCRRSEVWCGVACGALLVAKIDSAPWIGCLMLVTALRDRRIPWRALLWTLLTALPWIIFSTVYFGSPIPHTIEAKRIAYAATARFDILDAITLTVPDAYKSNPWIVACFGIFTYGTLVLASWRVSRTKEWIFLSFPMYCILYVVVLLASGTSAGLWTRWTVPLWGSLIVSLGYSLPLLPLPWNRLTAAATGPMARVMMLILFCAMLLSPFVYQNRRYLDMNTFQATGEWLRDHAQQSESVFLEPIGLIGYLSKLEVHDYVGLVSPGITEARKQSGLSNRWFGVYVRTQAPTYLVLRDEEIRTNEFIYAGYGDQIFTVEEQKWFGENYSEVFRTRTDVDRLVVFRKMPPH